MAGEQELEHLKERGCRWIEKVQRYRKDCTPEKTVHMRREKGIRFISHDDGNYPDRLRRLPDHPYGLFYRGKLPPEESRAVAVVGARMCTRCGKETAERMGGGIALAGGAVISGAAYGVDGAAQWAALEKHGYSCAVLGCGVDRCYPASNAALFHRLEAEGGIVSEFPPGTEPRRHHFPMRNRIISGLSDVVAVVEARSRSGSLITAEFGAEQGKRVMAVPGRPGDELSEGCNELIAQGAEIILSVESFVKTVFPDYRKKQKKLSEDLILAPSEKLVYSSLGLHSKSIWELEECTALSLAEMSECLMSLELKGLIRETERNCYALSDDV
ncbi:MAG: DNA-processing protein DprA [Candidatus Choladocola sp.]|nr:DNA-processing protein DprA [Candidatus Choladocola sp.]